MKVVYDPEVDVLSVLLSDGPVGMMVLDALIREFNGHMAFRAQRGRSGA